MTRPTGDQVNGVVGQMFELLRLIRNGTRSATEVKQGLQHLIQGEPLLPPINGLVHGRFTPTETQLAWMRCWNKEYAWGFTEADFESLGEPPNWLADNPLAAIVLTPYLDTPEQTYNELWRIAASRQPRSFHRPLRESDYGEWAQLELAPGLTHSRRLAWELVDLGYGVGREEEFVHIDRQYKRPPHTAHAAVLAAAAQHPEWVRQMREMRQDGHVPCVVIVGYRADRGKYLEPFWDLVPSLGWGAKVQWMVLEYTHSITRNEATPIHLPID